MDEFDALKAQAVTALNKKDYLQAVELFDKAYEIDPGDPEILFNLAVAHTRIERFSEAGLVLEELLRLNSGFTGIIKVYQLQLFCLLQLEEFTKAGPIFDDVLGRYGENVELLSLYGFYLEQIGQLAEAKATFEKVLSLQPDNLNALNSLVYIKAHLDEDVPASLKEAARLLKEKPNNAAYLDTFGTLLKKMGLYDQAERAFKRGIALSGGHPEILKHLEELSVEEATLKTKDP